MAVCSFVFMPVVLLTSAVLLTGGQHTTQTSRDSERNVEAGHKASKAARTAVCTGAIDKSGVILTTATCTDRAGGEILGSTTAYDSNRRTHVDRDTYEVHKCRQHSDSNSKINMINLAVMKLKREIKIITDLVSPLMEANLSQRNGASSIETYWLLQTPLPQLSSSVPTPCADADTYTRACAEGTEGGDSAGNGKVVGNFSGITGNDESTPERVGFVNVVKHYDFTTTPQPLAWRASSALTEDPLHSAFHIAIATAVSVLFIRLTVF